MVFKKNPLIFNNSNSYKMENVKQSAGILDDFAVRKTIATQQGRITNTPVNDLDIANKKYVDSAIIARLLDANEIHANAIITSLFRANTIYGNSLTLQSDSGGDVPTATPLYFKTLTNQAAKINIPNRYGQTYWEFPDNSFFVGDNMILGSSDETSYFTTNLDDYSYLTYALYGMQIYTNNDAVLVLDAYPDGTTEWHEDGKYDKNLDAATYSVGGIAGISATITTAKLTSGGANGSMTFVNGILTAQTAAT